MARTGTYKKIALYKGQIKITSTIPGSDIKFIYFWLGGKRINVQSIADAKYFINKKLK